MSYPIRPGCKGDDQGDGKTDPDLNGQPLVPSVHSVRISNEAWSKARALYLAGTDWDTIASELGAKRATLEKRAQREKLHKVKKEVKSVSLKKENTIEALSILVRSKLAQDAAETIERVNGYALDGIKDEATREQVLGSVAKRSALVFGWAEAGESPQVSVNILGALPDRAEVRVEPADK